MNTSLDGKIKLTKQEWEIIHNAPRLAALIQAQCGDCEVEVETVAEAFMTLEQAVRACDGE